MSSDYETLHGELEASCRALAKRVRGMVQTAERRSVDHRFVQRLREIAEALVAAPRGMNSHPALAQGAVLEPTRIARSMTAAIRKDAPAPSTTPPPRQADEVPGLLRGSSDSVPMHRLLSFLADLGKTGVLWVTTREETFTIQFRAGTVVNAFSNKAPVGQRLGEILVEQGAITEADLDRLLDTFRPDGRARFGGHLLNGKRVTVKQLTAALETQVRKLTERLLRADRAAFTFSERRGPEEDAGSDVRLRVADLLLGVGPPADGAMQLDWQPARPPRA
jgi:hypothetical protein